MKKINFLSFLFALVFSNLYGQTFHLYENNKFQTRKISVVKFTADTLEIKCFLNPSVQCVCDPYDIYKLTKNQFGNYCAPLNYGDDDSQNKFIQANLYDGKIKSISIKGNKLYHCCDVASGIYLVKPTPPSGSKTTPKLSIVNAAPKQFYDFWNAFKAKMNNKDSIKPLIHFPYFFANGNSLTGTQITLDNFSKYSTEEFRYGFTFINNIFTDYAYPKNKGLFFGQIFDFDGEVLTYLSEELKNHFITQFGNLNGIYVVSELPSYFKQVTYNYDVLQKAYFRAKDDSYEFIGFEYIELGD
jgi:hypothetical protein